MRLAARHQQAGAQEQDSSGRPCRERFSEAEEQDLSIFLLDDGDNGIGMDETMDPARNGRNRPASRPVRGAASSVQVCVAVRGIPAVPDGTGTELITMVTSPVLFGSFPREIITCYLQSDISGVSVCILQTSCRSVGKILALG
jgi:hypothetical protein